MTRLSAANRLFDPIIQFHTRSEHHAMHGLPPAGINCCCSVIISRRAAPPAAAAALGVHAKQTPCSRARKDT